MSQLRSWNDLELILNKKKNLFPMNNFLIIFNVFDMLESTFYIEGIAYILALNLSKL